MATWNQVWLHGAKFWVVLCCALLLPEKEEKQWASKKRKGHLEWSNELDSICSYVA
jgi:hypothetical protein